MLTSGTLMLWFVVGMAGVAVWHLLGKRMVAAEARDRRRRSRNYGRVISRRHGPTVRLAARVPRD